MTIGPASAPSSSRSRGAASSIGGGGDFARDRVGATVRIDRPLALALLLHDWPDNVRGLRAILDTAAIEAEGSLLTLSARVTQQLAYRMPPPEPPAVEAVRYRKERPGGDYLVKRLAEVGNVKALAHELGVARNTLYRWFRDEGIDPKSILS